MHHVQKLGASTLCLAYRFFVAKNVTQSRVHQVLVLFQKWNLSLGPLWLDISYHCKNLLIKEWNTKIEWEVIEKHNLYSPMQKSNMQIWKWEDSVLPLIQLIKLSLLEITWGFIPFTAIFNWTDRKIYCHRRDPPPGYTVLPVACRGLVQNFAATPLKKEKY